MKVFKSCITRSAFTTRKATLGGETDKPAAKANKPSKKSNEKSKKKGNRKRKQSFNNNFAQTALANIAASTSISGGSPNPMNQNSTSPQKRNKTDKCTACGGTSHKFSRCYLVWETSDKEWVDREVFDNNIKVPTFRKRWRKSSLLQRFLRKQTRNDGARMWAKRIR